MVPLFQVQIMCSHQARLALISFGQLHRLQLRRMSSFCKMRSHLVSHSNSLALHCQIDFLYKANTFKKHERRSHARSHKHRMRSNGILLAWRPKPGLGEMSAPLNSIVMN